MWISWTQRPGSRVPSTYLQNLHNISIAIPYGAISTVLKTSRTLLEKDIKTNPVIIDELSGPVYILTGILPIEAQIHIKALTFFNNVCHQDEKNTEKKLARRQLTVNLVTAGLYVSTKYYENTT